MMEHTVWYPLDEGEKTKIPIRNLWLLMFYASDLYAHSNTKNITIEENPDDLVDVIAEILTDSTEERIRSGLSVDLERRYANLSRVRGRIDVMRTECQQLLMRGQIACIFDEFTVDTPTNRLVRGALSKLAPFVKKPELAQRCHIGVDALERAGVSAGCLDSDLGRGHARLVADASQIIPEDRLMLEAAVLAHDLEMPTEDESGTLDWITPRRPKKMWELFEKAVANFYKIRFGKTWHVQTQKQISWQHNPHTEKMARLMPYMRPDITLEKGPRHNPTSRIIIDTKFAKITSKHHDNERISSHNIYQIYAYLRSQEGLDAASDTSTGILLHPSVGTKFDESTKIQGHRIRFVTVDLMSDTKSILDRLLKIIQD